MQSTESIQQTTVVARIVASLADCSRKTTVAEVRIGLGYTAVLLTDGHMGVAYTFCREARGGCTVFERLRPLSGRPARDLLPLLDSADPIEAGVGLACANALANRPNAEFIEGDILQHLDVGPKDRVGMVGNFVPLVAPLKKRCRSLTIFEKVETVHGDFRPSQEAAELLPQCQVALITATSIINHSLDTLLAAAGNCRAVVLLGASTPLLPGAFSALGVTALSGVVVKDPQRIMRVVSEGGGMRFFKPYVSKVSLPTANIRKATGRRKQ